MTRPDGHDATGLIPAHAGKTVPGSPHLRNPGAHPRACGENAGEHFASVLVSGSSPRMRGKHTVIRDNNVSRGLIPAHAGKTRPSSRAQPEHWAHPRACGENWLFPLGLNTPTGSSPRMRGKQTIPGLKVTHEGLIPGLKETHEGLIPAHAGKTADSPPRPRSRPAHPRACGENFIQGMVKGLVQGSSPRMRGKPERR